MLDVFHVTAYRIVRWNGKATRKDQCSLHLALLAQENLADEGLVNIHTRRASYSKSETSTLHSAFHSASPNSRFGATFNIRCCCLRDLQMM